MKSRALPSFWSAYGEQDEWVKERARKAFRVSLENPFHPSLRFKCVNAEEGVWSVRLSRGHRALGVMEGHSVVWYWIGGHDEYQRRIS